MGFLDAHAGLLLVGVALLALASLLVPRLLRSATSGDPTLALCGIYVMGIAPCLESFLDPSLTGQLSYRVSEAATVLIYALAMIAIVGSLRASWSRGGAYWALMIYGLALILSGLVHDSLPRNLWVLPLSALIVSSTQSLTIGLLLTHLRVVGRIMTGASLYLALTDYSSVQFTENGRTLLGHPQLSGATPHPNVLGAVAAFALLFELASNGSKRRLGNLFGLVTAACCLVLAQSHGGWLMACLGIAVLAFGSRRIQVRGIRVSVIFLSGIFVAFFAYRSVTTEPGRSLVPGLAFLNGRTEVWNIALEPFHSNPWWGGGPSVFDLQFRLQNGPLGVTVGQAHNQLIQALATGGIVVASCFVLVVATWLIAARRQWRLGMFIPMVMVVMLLADSGVESPMRGYLAVQTFMTLATLMALRAQPLTHPSQLPPRGKLAQMRVDASSEAVVNGIDETRPNDNTRAAMPRGAYWA